MKKTVFLIALVALTTSSVLRAQDETAHHRKVYAEINEKAETYKTVTAEMEVEHAFIGLSGWTDTGKLRKIVATVGGEHGSGSEEYYIEDGKLLFLYSVHTTENLETGKTVNRTEDRYYFKDGDMIKWLSGKEEPFEPGSRDFKMIADSISADFANYKGILEKKTDGKAATKIVVGKFTGIEEGDYSHWNMKSEDGNELSYFILGGGETIDPVLDDPKKFIGRKCRVAFQTSMVNIPEAGGEMEISQITGIEWIE